MYNEKYRMQYHFSPQENWMNDPNGLIYYGGEYHLFYQYNPESSKWGPMHWGHAISEDLLHWEHMPVALSPDELGTIFSGCAVVDHLNRSGLKTGTEDVIVAFFTHHEENNEKQSIAYSNDKGRTWIKYKNNPVISNPGLKDFRDPKVFWDDEGERWIMLLACGDHIRFYSSANLLEWEFLSTFGKEYGSHEGTWECPDLVQLPIEGSNETKWALIIGIYEGAPNGGSGVQYFIGEFDGEKFYPDEDPDVTRWVDHGRDFYASVTWSNTPDNKEILIGWMSNWQYANDIPTSPWRGSMTIPRALSLYKDEEDWCLVQKPIDSISSLKVEAIVNDNHLHVTPANSYMISELDSQVEINLKVNTEETTSDSWGICLRKGNETGTDIRFNNQEQKWYLDRTKSGETNFSKDYPSIDVGRYNCFEEIEEIKILLDHSSIELFINDGKGAMTSLIFPLEQDLGFEIYAIDGNLLFESVKITKLMSTQH